MYSGESCFILFYIPFNHFLWFFFCFVPLQLSVALKKTAEMCVCVCLCVCGCSNLAYLTPPTDGGEWTNTEIQPCTDCPSGTTNSYARVILSFGRDEAGRQFKTVQISTKLMPYCYLSQENKGIENIIIVQP